MSKPVPERVRTWSGPFSALGTEMNRQEAEGYILDTDRKGEPRWYFADSDHSGLTGEPQVCAIFRLPSATECPLCGHVRD